MIRMLVIGVLAMGLSACIDEDDDDKTGLDVDVSQFKGAEQPPALAASSAVSDGDSVSINSEYSGSVTDGATEAFAYTALADGLVAIVLTSTAEDLELTVTDGNVSYKSENMDSNEAVVLQVVANQQYGIEVISSDGAGTYDLVVTDANRSSLGLSDNEYWINFDISGQETCNQSTVNDAHVGGSIINFNEGYLADVSGADRDNFSSVSGNTFSIESSESESVTGFSYTSNFKLSLSLNEAAGSLTGSSTSTSSETSSNGTEDCSSEFDFEGKILL